MTTPQVPLHIHKYGGSSVASIDQILRLANHVKNTIQKNKRVLVVISAMGDQTDDLLKLAKKISPNPPLREVDMLLTAGERISMSLMSIALHKQGVKCCSFTGSQSGIITDEVHGNARIIRILGDRIRKALDEGNVVIVAGFQGVSSNSKEITTLGRGGSDLSAVALAHALGAERCELYKDVDGVYTENPGIVKAAKKINTINWSTMMELCLAGSQVLQPRSLFLAQKFKIPICVRSSLELNKEGTMIDGVTMEAFKVEAMTHAKSLSRFSVKIAGSEVLQCYHRIVDWLWTQGEIAKHTSISKTMESGIHELVLLISSGLLERTKEQMEIACNEYNLEIISTLIMDHLAQVSLVGRGFLQAPELSKFVANCLSDYNVIDFNISTQKLSITVDEKDQISISNKLHEAFLEASA